MEEYDWSNVRVLVKGKELTSIKSIEYITTPLTDQIEQTAVALKEFSTIIFTASLTFAEHQKLMRLLSRPKKPVRFRSGVKPNTQNRTRKKHRKTRLQRRQKRQK